METREIKMTALKPSVSDLRSHLRITAHDLDAELVQKLRSAVVSAENEISTVIAPSKFVLNTKPSSSFLRLRWPVTSVTSVRVDGETMETGFSWDEDGIRFDEPVDGSTGEVEYEAGLAYVPDDIQGAILLLASSLFNNPTDRPEERDRTTARNLLRPYRRWEGRR